MRETLNTEWLLVTPPPERYENHPMLFLLHFVPKNTLSLLFGWLAHRSWPPAINTWLIRAFARHYKINLAEAEFSAESYPSLGEFFARRLKPGSRPIDQGPYVHPADAQIIQIGPIDKEGRCVQAKGRLYHIEHLLLDPQWEQSFQFGSFAVYYLCPSDYHRVHSPVDGEIWRVRAIPGRLWPVNFSAVEGIDNLYPQNERVVIDISTPMGPLALVMVGAMNVGRIELTVDPAVRTNSGRGWYEKVYDSPLAIRKGQELGVFRMGSTVVMVYSKGISDIVFRHLKLGKTLVGRAPDGFPFPGG